MRTLRDIVLVGCGAAVGFLLATINLPPCGQGMIPTIRCPHCLGMPAASGELELGDMAADQSIVAFRCARNHYWFLDGELLRDKLAGEYRRPDNLPRFQARMP